MQQKSRVFTIESKQNSMLKAKYARASKGMPWRGLDPIGFKKFNIFLLTCY